MGHEETGSFDVEQVMIRLAREADRAVLRELFEAGLLERLVPDNDTGADIENLQEAYFSDEGQSGFWVAELNGQIIGMVGVQQTTDNQAEIRRLRVREDFRRCGVGSRLMEAAVGFCQRLGYLKVILDVRFDRVPAIALFEKFGFTLGRTREVNGRRMLEFYIDLYREPGI